MRTNGFAWPIVDAGVRELKQTAGIFMEADAGFFVAAADMRCNVTGRGDRVCKLVNSCKLRDQG